MVMYECKYCDYQTNKKSSIDNHLQGVHLKERSFQCEFCEFKTHHKGSLSTTYENS